MDAFFSVIPAAAKKRKSEAENTKGSSAPKRSKKDSPDCSTGREDEAGRKKTATSQRTHRKPSLESPKKPQPKKEKGKSSSGVAGNIKFEAKSSNKDDTEESAKTRSLVEEATSVSQKNKAEWKQRMYGIFRDNVGLSPEKKRSVCKFFLQKRCHKADCRFTHNLKDAPCPLFYMLEDRNLCPLVGEDCWYSHGTNNSYNLTITEASSQKSSLDLSAFKSLLADSGMNQGNIINSSGKISDERDLSLVYGSEANKEQFFDLYQSLLFPSIANRTNNGVRGKKCLAPISVGLLYHQPDGRQLKNQNKEAGTTTTLFEEVFRKDPAAFAEAQKQWGPRRHRDGDKSKELGKMRKIEAAHQPIQCDFQFQTEIPQACSP